jgi:hypothetical protein
MMTRAENDKSRTQPSKASGTTTFRAEIDSREQLIADAAAGPIITNAIVLGQFIKGTVGEIQVDAITAALAKSAVRVHDKNFTQVEGILSSQAFVLNTMFGDLSRRSVNNLDAGYLEAGAMYLKLALKAQNQCRMTLETLSNSNIKNPPVVYARQANISSGPQQVNNGTSPASRTTKTENLPNKLLEQSDEQAMDTGTAGTPGRSNPAMATVGKGNRATDG